LKMSLGSDAGFSARDFRKGSIAVFNRAGQNRPLLRGKQSSHVGFRRSAKLAADLFPPSGVKPTLWKVAVFVCKLPQAAITASTERAEMIVVWAENWTVLTMSKTVYRQR